MDLKDLQLQILLRFKMDLLLCIFVVGLTVILCRYIMSEGYRIDRHKKFMKNMDEFDTKKIKNDKKQTTKMV